MSIRKALSLRTDHHAYLVPGGEVFADQALFSFPNLGINEARSLKERAQLASAGEEVVVYCGAMTEEGQNALLKTLEEPARGITFILLAPKGIKLLPTLLSRLVVVENQDENGKEKDFGEIEKFVEVNSEARLKFVTDFLKKHEENHKNEALKFLTNLEQYLARKVKPEEANDQMIFALAQVRQGREYLQDKSGTARLILEHIALVLPALK